MRWLRTYGDPLLAVALAMGWVAELATYHPHDYPLTAVVGVVASLAMSVRRRLPLASYVVFIVMSQANALLDPDYAHNGLFPLAVLVLSLYTLGAHSRGPEAWLALLGVGAAIAGIASTNHDYSVTAMAFYVALCGLPWGVGVAVRLRLDRLRDLERRNSELRDEAARAVAAERGRIARELHDVVSHAIAVTVLQSRGCAKLVGRDGDAVRRALDAIEQTNTAALADMRRLLALLRDQDAADGRHEPAPALDRLDRLVEQVRASGLPVELTVTGEPLPVPPGLDISAYRIVQEALTNVLKHGGPDARAWVTVHYDVDDLTVTVTDVGATPTGDGTGHGLRNIRERVAVTGGSLEAGPEGDGFAVRARLPYLLVSA